VSGTPREHLTTRDLRTRSSDALKRVKEEGAHFTVTSHGRPVAALVPIAGAPDPVRWKSIREVRERLARNAAGAALLGDLAHLREQTTDDLPH
jgi:prevent-host-death family protein